tara:strand:- start:509 stop:1348 length:840 start_codon:yes stop_codon:yes gene_type:complete
METLKSLIVITIVGTFLVTAGAEATGATRNQVKQMVVEEAQNSIVPPALALAVAKVESDFQFRALSHKGARGIMQIMPRTAEVEFGVHPDELWDPRLNVQLGIGFLERLHGKYDNDWKLALSHYNGGTLKLQEGSHAMVHPYTRKYIDLVFRWWKRYQDQADIWSQNNIVSINQTNTVPSVPMGVKHNENYGDPDPKSSDDVEYQLLTKIKHRKDAKLFANIPTVRRKSTPVKKSEIKVRKYIMRDATRWSSMNNFWDRVSHARNTLDDFGPKKFSNPG